MMLDKERWWQRGKRWGHHGTRTGDQEGMLSIPAEAGGPLGSLELGILRYEVGERRTQPNTITPN